MSEESQKERNEEEPLQQNHPLATSYGETLTNFLKGLIGVGIFAMGEAFKHGGLLVASFFILFISATVVHTMHILVKCAREVSLHKIDSNNPPDFAETIEYCFKMGPNFACRQATLAKRLVNVCICFTQLGLCCVYFVFVATNVKQVMDVYTSSLDVRIYMTLALVPILLLSWIRNLKYLAPLSGTANLLMAVVIAITLYFCVSDLPPLSERQLVGEWESLPLTFGIIVLCFDCISLILPIQNAMKSPEKFVAPLGVLNCGMTIITVLFIVMGVFGYLKFGEQVLPSVTLNLPTNNLLANITRLTVALVILFTYALHFFIAVEVIWPQLETLLFPQTSETRDKPCHTFSELTVRSLLVLFTYCVALLIPHLGLFISLLGSVSGTFLTFIFPPLAELFLFHGVVSRPLIAKNIVIITVGLIGCVAGSYTSIVAIVRAFSQQH